MKAIWMGDVYHVAEDYGEGLALDHGEGRVYVPFGDRDLIVDPTDDQVDAARAGLPIPPDPDDILVIAPDGSETNIGELRPWEAKALLDLGATLLIPATAQRIARLDYLRGEIEAESISWGEIAELQGLAEYIDPSDVLLLEWAGVPEQGGNGK